MKKRYLAHAVQELGFDSQKMVLLSGPRQCGKTTFSKALLRERKAGAYYNWDQAEFRRVWSKNPQSLVDILPTPKAQVPLVVLDEIHKDRLWKRTLKGIFDTQERRVDLLVTGSARLAVYRRGGDSLLGRQYSVRLHPFSVGELVRRHPPEPESALAEIFEDARPARGTAHEAFQGLLRYGPFPEPFLSQNERRVRIWQDSRRELVMREDLRDLTHVVDVSRVETLASLLPERVGSPTSVNGLREILEVTHESVQRWLLNLRELFYTFELKPFAKRISRSLKKESKTYLWEYGELKDPGARFENLVAAHLLKACHYWSDTGHGKFELCYLRNRDGKELDFLVTRDDTPWLPVEAKLSDTAPSPNWTTFLPQLGCRLAVQIVANNVRREVRNLGDCTLLVASADEVLRCLP
ncbi:MAG: AAA family ATPase [Polyangiaceae bacterium]|nr:AAA family ATPase [Polyangiaceae bacterium]